MGRKRKLALLFILKTHSRAKATAFFEFLWVATRTRDIPAYFRNLSQVRRFWGAARGTLAASTFFAW